LQSIWKINQYTKKQRDPNQTSMDESHRRLHGDEWKINDLEDRAHESELKHK
jgi:hypothetical protein